MAAGKGRQQRRRTKEACWRRFGVDFWGWVTVCCIVLMVWPTSSCWCTCKGVRADVRHCAHTCSRLGRGPGANDDHTIWFFCNNIVIRLSASRKLLIGTPLNCGADSPKATTSSKIGPTSRIRRGQRSLLPRCHCSTSRHATKHLTQLALSSAARGCALDENMMHE